MRRFATAVEQLENRTLLTTFFVDGDIGNDANSGGLFDPFATIQAGIDAAAAKNGDDKVAIAAGVYEEDLVIDDPSGALVLEGRTFRPGDVVVDGNGGNAITVTSAKDLTIRNLRVTDGFHGISDLGSSSLVVDRVIADSNKRSGIYHESAGDVTIRYATVTNNGFAGGSLGAVRVAASGNVTIIGSNISQNPDAPGISLLQVGDVTIRSTKANDNGGVGANIFGTKNVTISNSEFSRNEKQGINLFAADDVQILWTKANHNALNDGLAVASSSSVVIQGGSFNHNGADGIHLENIRHDVDITWTTADFNSGDGLDLEGAEHVSIWLSWFNWNDGEGMNIDSVGDVHLFFASTVGNGPPNYTLDNVVIRP